MTDTKVMGYKDRRLWWGPGWNPGASFGSNTSGIATPIRTVAVPPARARQESHGSIGGPAGDGGADGRTELRAHDEKPCHDQETKNHAAGIMLF